jgi:KaiC/GvpD/RAD55 family RecA-like ATPase
MRERIETGIGGIDRMLYGGIPEGNQIVIAGGPGSGKTLLCFEYLYNNAINGQIGLFISLEEDTGLIIENAKEAFSDFKDIDKMIADKKIVVHGANDTRSYIQRDAQGSSYTFGKFVTEIESLIESTNATRVVIDSVSIIKLLMKDPFEYRNTSMSLVAVLRRSKVTALLTMEIESSEKNKLIFQPEFFIYDGIIIMYSSAGEGGSRIPTMEIIKMRGSNHSFATVPYEITAGGINLMLLAERRADG